MTIDDRTLNDWFCREVLPLERSLMAFIRRNSRVTADLVDLRQDIYERVLVGAQTELPHSPKAYVFTIARNHLINNARRAQVVSFELIADMADVTEFVDMLETERHLNARDELRRALDALNQLPPRCREVIRLRKVEGLSTRETAERMDVGINTVEKQITNGMRAIADFMLGGSGRVRRTPSPTRAAGRERKS